MAIAATNLDSGASFNSGNNSFNTASITVAANRLYVVSVESFLNSGAVNTPTISGASQTWDQIGTQLQSNNLRVTLFKCMPSSGASGALTIAHGGQTQIACSWSVNEFTGAKTSGSNGADAIVQNVGNSGSGSQSGGTVTLAAFANASNAAYGSSLFQQGNSQTAGSGFSLLSQTGVGTQSFHTEFEATQDTTVDWTWSSASGQWAAMAIEIAIGSSPGFFPFF